MATRKRTPSTPTPTTDPVVTVPTPPATDPAASTPPAAVAASAIIEAAMSDVSAAAAALDGVAATSFTDGVSMRRTLAMRLHTAFRAVRTERDGVNDERAVADITPAELVKRIVRRDDPAAPFAANDTPVTTADRVIGYSTVSEAWRFAQYVPTDVLYPAFVAWCEVEAADGVRDKRNGPRDYLQFCTREVKRSGARAAIDATAAAEIAAHWHKVDGDKRTERETAAETAETKHTNGVTAMRLRLAGDPAAALVDGVPTVLVSAVAALSAAALVSLRDAIDYVIAVRGTPDAPAATTDPAAAIPTPPAAPSMVDVMAEIARLTALVQSAATA